MAYNTKLGRETTPTEEDWLVRNPNDEGRMAAALSNVTSGRSYDSQDTTKYDTYGNFLGSGSVQPTPLSRGNTFGPSGIDDPTTGAELSRLQSAFDQINQDLVSSPTAIDVPGINMNEDIDASLLSLMRGTDTSTLETDDAIRRLLQEVQTGSPQAEARRTKRMLTATENAQLAQQGLMEQLRAQLGDAGTVGLPGVPQGMETAGARRVTERVATPFSQAIRDIDIDESQQADTRQLNALQLATGWSGDKAQRVLQAAAAGTDRQRIMSEIALETLQTNQAWNSFLATFGLERERFMQDVRAGNMDRIGGIIQQFQTFLSQLRGGYIGND